MHTDRQAGRQADRQTDRHRQTCILTYVYTYLNYYLHFIYDPVISVIWLSKSVYATLNPDHVYIYCRSSDNV